ncbi:ATP-binding cassette domain-containing protein [Solimonas sp. K1W22B-7]|uniref:ATP-binding cassette domain-containing protein n=1 Tax=Solimonas sp. K1W22B-7 TaxID=2303331 RepID=UPI000E32F652|nr:ATP-binding cassette domain-containing protein [Solimonas sp. K1W22B-7]AXQ30202.1 ATP-binding cassette domain-containing protein [Solimonas sp. K1W22B-7]
MRIDLERFRLAFGPRVVFDQVTASLDWDATDDASRVIGLMGPSGSGKSTLAKQVMTARYHGRVAGINVVQPDLVIAYLPQAAVLFSHLSIYRNARLLEGVGRYRMRFDPAIFADLAKQLKLESILASKIGIERISGGEAQRLMLLRTLSVRPDLLILDEPATGLDPSIREDFLIDLQGVLRRLGICALYISHHWEEVAFLAGRVVFAETIADCSGGIPSADFRLSIPMLLRGLRPRSMPFVLFMALDVPFGRCKIRMQKEVP